MSTIKVANIRIASEAVSRPVTGVAAAWCRITSAAAVQSSLNISSCTDLGTGDRRFNFSNSYDSTTSYTCNISSYFTSANSTGAFMDTVNVTSPSASSTICSHFEQGNPVSVAMFFTSHGELA